MEATPVQDSPVAAAPREPIRVVAIVLLATFTMFITWRARIVETSLERASEQPALVEKPAPDFSAVTLDNRTVSLADFRGQKKLIVSFWASWCGPCRVEMPELAAFYKKYHARDAGFEILAVSIDEDPKDAEDYATQQKLAFPVLLDPHEKMAEAFEVEGIPTIFVIDEYGKIIYGRSGFDSAIQYRLAHELGLGKKQTSEGATDGSTSN